MTTTTIELAGAQLTVETQALFRAWMEKNLITSPPLALTIPVSRPGERYVGAITKANGSGHHIYLQSIERGLILNWNAAIAHAAERGLDLPDRTESALLFAEREEGEFEEAAYWTRDQYAGNDACAWYQYFGNGYQSGYHKDNELRVVLVRRVAIHPFSH